VMDAACFERVYDHFQDFDAFLRPPLDVTIGGSESGTIFGSCWARLRFGGVTYRRRCWGLGLLERAMELGLSGPNG